MPTKTARTVRMASALFGASIAAVLGGSPVMAAGGRANSVPSAKIVPGEIIVQYQTGLSPTTRVGALSSLAGAQVVRSMLVPDTDLVSVRPGTEAAAVAALGKNPNVRYAEVNRILHATAVPNDSSFRLLWGLNNTGQSVNGTAGTPDADIDAPEAWNLASGLTTSSLVAVTDTGITFTHPDLAGNIYINRGEYGGGKETNGIDDDHNGYVNDWRGWDFVNNDNDPTDDDFGVWHGTHVSGTIAAISNNAAGVSGVASFPTRTGRWASPRILVIKVLDSGGSGTVNGVADGFMYAGKMGAKVVNVSLGGFGTSTTIDDAILANPNTLYVIAAGNETNDNDSFPVTPCVSTPGVTIPNKICVAATDSTDRLAGFSNYGRTTVDIAAPGVNILSTMPASGYQYLDGTSMATPHVVGAAIFLNAIFGGSTPAQIKDKILRGVDRLAALRGLVATSGRLNLYKAGAESSVRKTRSYLEFVANRGESNHVGVRNITINGVPMYEFSDNYTNSTTPVQGGSRIVAGNGCVPVNDNVARCYAAGITRIFVGTGNLDDVIDAPDIHIPMTVNGGSGSDLLVTGSGDDALYGGAGPDRFYAGKGNDTIYARDGDADLVFDCGENASSSDAAAGDRDVVFTDRGLDTIAASPSNCEVVHAH